MGLTAKAEYVGSAKKIANSITRAAKNFVFMTLPPLKFICLFYFNLLFHPLSLKKICMKFTILRRLLYYLKKNILDQCLRFTWRCESFKIQNFIWIILHKNIFWKKSSLNTLLLSITPWLLPCQIVYVQKSHNHFYMDVAFFISISYLS